MFCFHTALFEHLKGCTAVQKYNIDEMSQISLIQFCVTGHCEPSACVRLKPSPRQTLSKNGTLCLCYNAEIQWL